SSWASMITLMAFSVNRSNMGRGLLRVTPTYQGWTGVCDVATHKGRPFATAGALPPDLNN
ncbi:MAG: hypothetical protein EBX49_02270, partial [Synechococcaceae bacterium WB8_1B_136]|nr:hypothetical protein [Synechococcaceae bacterium WB8_1B_136]